MSVDRIHRIQRSGAAGRISVGAGMSLPGRFAWSSSHWLEKLRLKAIWVFYPDIGARFARLR